MFFPNWLPRRFFSVVNPHQRCGYSDSPFARVYLFHTAGSGSGLEEVDTVCPGKLNPRKRHFFLMERYIEDARQDEKRVPDLLEAIMRPKLFVKEEPRPNLFKMIQIISKNQKNQGFNFLDSGNPKFSRRRPMLACSPVSFMQYLAPPGAKSSKK